MRPRLHSLATMATCAVILAAIVAIRGSWYTAPALGIAYLAGLQATLAPQRPACRRRTHTVPAAERPSARRGRRRAHPGPGWRDARAVQSPSRPRHSVRARVQERVR